MNTKLLIIAVVIISSTLIYLGSKTKDAGEKVLNKHNAMIEDVYSWSK